MNLINSTSLQRAIKIARDAVVDPKGFSEANAWQIIANLIMLDAVIQGQKEEI